MNTKILHITEQESDFLLLEKILKQSGNLYIVEGRGYSADIERYIDQYRPAIIVSDNADVFAMLVLLESRPFKIPLIVLTDPLPDFVAVKMLKAGAHDYVLKQDIGTIPGILKELTKEFEHPVHNESTYKACYEYAIDGVFLTIPDGTILACNPAA